MNSRPSQAWDYSGSEYVRPGDKPRQTNDMAPVPYSHHHGSGAGFTQASAALVPATDNSHRRSESQQRLTRRLSLSDSSDKRSASLNSTKASTGRASPPSTATASSQHNFSLPSRPSRANSSAVRPGDHPAPNPVRPQHGLEQYGGQPSHSTSHSTAQASLRNPLPSNSISQQSIFSNPHGIREPAAPPRLSASRPRPTSMVLPPTFTATAPIPDDHGLPGFMSVNNRQLQMPGAFPSEAPVLYRRPTDLTTQIANESTDRLSSNSDSWDSEGDNWSTLSTSTNATTVASDITVGKGETYETTPTRTAFTSSGTATPTNEHHQHDGDGAHPRLVVRSAHAPAPPAPILRRTGPKTVLSSTKTPSSVTKSASTSTHHHARTATSGSGTSSARRNSQSGGPSIHIEVHRPDSRVNTQSDARMRQKIEEVLLDKIVQLRSEETKHLKEARSAPAPAPAKQSLTVRFAEPVPQTTKQDRPAPIVAPTPEREDRPGRSKELVPQSKEIHKLELEIEKRDMLIKERERIDQERKVQDERARAEREKERERDRQNLEIEKRETQKTQKAEQLERQKERQQFEREKKDIEKAQKTLEKERAKERQQVDQERQDLEQEKLKIDKAQREHEKLRASFIDQGKILDDLKVRFDGQAKTLEATQAERNELKQVKDEFEKKCSDLTKSLSHVSDKERYVVEQVASLQIIKESMQKRIGPLEERVARMTTELSGLHSERDDLMRDTKTYLLRITDLEKEIKGLVEEKRGFTSQIDELEKDKSGLTHELKGRQEQIVALEANIEARATDYSEHIATLRNEHKSQVGDFERQIATLKDEHKAEVEAKMSSLSSEHKTHVQEFQEQIVDLNEHIDGAHGHVEKLTEDIRALENTLHDEKSKLDAVTAERDQLATDLEGHKMLAVSQETNILNLRDDIARRSDALAKLQEVNKTLQAEHEELHKLADTVAGPETKHISEAKDLPTQDEELSTAKTVLEAKTAELEAQAAATKTELEARIAQLEADRDAATAALVTEQAEKNTLADTAAQVPALLGEKTALEAKAANLEAKTAALESQVLEVPTLRADCARLTEQLAAANKLIEGLTAAQQAGLNTNPLVSPAVTPLSPTFPEPENLSAAPPQPPQDSNKPRKVRSRAPSMVRSVSSRSSSIRKTGGIKDDIALVMVRNPADRGNVQIVRKCDLRAPRSRSQPPDKE